MENEEPIESYFYSTTYKVYRLVVILVFCFGTLAISIVSLIQKAGPLATLFPFVFASLSTYAAIKHGNLRSKVGMELYLNRVEIFESYKTEVVHYRDIKVIVVPGMIEGPTTGFYVVDHDEKKHYFYNLDNIPAIAKRLQELSGKPIQKLP